MRPVPIFDPAPLVRLARIGQRTPADWAEAANMRRNTLYKHLKQPLTAYTADRLACALGFHPVEVWGDEWWEEAA